jgi:hypothetical protein
MSEKDDDAPDVLLMVLLHQILDSLQLSDAVSVMRRVYCPYRRALIASSMAVPTRSQGCDHEHTDMEAELHARPDADSNLLELLARLDMEMTMQ